MEEEGNFWKPPNRGMVRGRVCNESFRSAVDRSYDAQGQEHMEPGQSMQIISSATELLVNFYDFFYVDDALIQTAFSEPRYCLNFINNYEETNIDYPL